ncbi:cytochrome c1 [Phaeovulum vinaykumarii]|uniref:Cytochrome c1 n=1 Tax=Phaeovulum vinaykumarii TaxID=407234 RepID=A0A1N7MN71_9RHOB|nr:cytochrome c1 [Phaeovulum vinaykumarii]SIS87480.1 ubiquinol-cytochrome c reductase cytochrome c1 subunit [Phaeovulum vinaykumarii]SOC13123.1 ubiquinol-cytochrome c reductase cytochrome c1 subunit [Phaeovulum vinaykumarii]
MRKLVYAAISALALGSAPLLASEGGAVHDVNFSFEGPYGTYDKAQLRRGLQIFTEICSACHGMKFVPLRALGEPGGPELSPEEVREYASNLEIFDPELDDWRPRKISDNFPTVTGDGMGPDLSVMAKARAGFSGPLGTGLNQFFNGIGGPEYIYTILTSYTGEMKEEAGSLYYENHAFTRGNGWIAMPQQIYDDIVEYEDGSPTDAHALAKDVSAFLMWAAEPKLNARKQAGYIGVLMLVVLSVLLYFTNKTLWAPVKGKKKA